MSPLFGMESSYSIFLSLDLCPSSSGEEKKKCFHLKSYFPDVMSWSTAKVKAGRNASPLISGERQQEFTCLHRDNWLIEPNAYLNGSGCVTGSRFQ